MRAHGQAERYHHVRVGVNARLDTLQAAILLAKLEVFDAEVELREAAAQRYHAMIAGAGLAEAGVVAPTVDQGSTDGWAQYTIRVPNCTLVGVAMKPRGRSTTDT